MPELPEVETVVRGLAPHLPGRTVDRVTVIRTDIVAPSGRALTRRVQGRTLESVSRRAKTIVMPLQGGPGGQTKDRGVLTVHLGMTGRLLLFGPHDDARTGHPVVRFRLNDGGTLVYDDIRRFGRVAWETTSDWQARSARLGPEPLSRAFSWTVLRDGLAASRAPARSWLLDQRRVAGLGNIYANEALFLAGVHPIRPARDITEVEVQALHAGLKRTLRNAVRGGGTTLRDYVGATGEPGRYAPRLRVYGRDGHPCRTCGETVERIVFGGRSAFFCPNCQI